jgi:DDE superfamily endonuclease
LNKTARVADNLGSHRVAGVREAIEARGASLLFLPPYSPDLNPIEQVFAKLKTLLRRAEPRSRESLWQSIGNSLDRYTPQECKTTSKTADTNKPIENALRSTSPRSAYRTAAAVRPMSTLSDGLLRLSSNVEQA